MSLSSILIVVIALVGFSILIAIITLQTLRPSMTVSLTPKNGDLSKQLNVGTSGQARDTFMAGPSGTLSVYIRYELNGKTFTLGQDSNPIRIVQLGNALQLQLTPGSIKGKPSTNLIVKTQGTTTQNESISVMDFPEQKWIHLVIVREGRRYTVYYNGQIVASSRTKYFPTINSSQYIIGDQRLRGIFALPKLIPTAYTIDDVRAELQKTSDTRHEPHIDDTSTDSIFSTFTCPNGFFCFSTSSQPTLNPLKTWKTPYA